jgi:hypothetical protein
MDKKKIKKLELIEFKMEILSNPLFKPLVDEMKWMINELKNSWEELEKLKK